MAEYQWGGTDNNDLGYFGNWFPLQGGPPTEPGPNDVAIIEFGPALTGTLNVSALDLIQQGPGEPALTLTGASTQVTASLAGIGNTVTLDAGALLQVGTLSTAAGCVFLAAGANTSVDITSTVSLAGAVTLDAGASFYASAVSIAGTTTVTAKGGSTFDATVSTGNTMAIGDTAGHALLLVTGAGTSANIMSYDTEGDLNIGGASGSFATLSVTGQASLIATPDNLVIGAGQSSNGLLSVAGAGSSAIFECWGTVFVGVAPSATGTVSVTAGGYLELDSDYGVVDVASDTAAVVLVSGAGSELDAGPSLSIGGETVYDNAGKGQVTVQSGGLLYAFDKTQVQADGTITVAGAGSVFHTSQLDVLSQASVAVGSGGLFQAAIVTLNGGTIKLTGGMLNASASLTAQSGTLTGAGTVTSPRVINNGLFDASGGTLHLTGAVTGTGVMRIYSAATLQLDSTVASSQTVVFESGANVLALNDPHGFAGRILDFAAGDSIDLLKTAASSVTFRADTLQVYSGSTLVSTLHVRGQYTTGGFHLAADGHGGTAISYSSSTAIGVPNPHVAGHPEGMFNMHW